MIEIVPTLSFVLPIIAGCLVFITIVTTLYLRIRGRFLASVNCWFCNEWTKVLYSLKDSFTCPHCLQYNGFSKDGDYNKSIPEQHDELLNKGPLLLFEHNSTKTAPSNGLCTLCNNNQQLKVLQLARFVPMCEENYDKEIEHFQTQLEKAYKLCKKCDKVLRKTINKQSSWIFGNQIKTKKSNQSANKLRNPQKINSKLIIALNSISSILISVLILWTLLHNRLIYKKLTILTNNNQQYLSLLKELMLHGNGKNLALQNYIPWVGAIDNYTLYCSIGLFLQSAISLLSRNSMTEKINQLLCWTILIFTSTFMRLSRSYSFYVFILQLSCYGYLLFIKFGLKELTEPKKEKKKSFNINRFKRRQKLVNNLENTCSDFSDLSDNDISTSTTVKNPSNKSLSEESFNFSHHSSLKDEAITESTSMSKYAPELNTGLNNLNLGPRSRKSLPSPAMSPFSITNVAKRPKPVLSPPRFQGINNFNTNSWVAGGYFQPQPVYVNQLTTGNNLSRSSSESSGFGSQINENNFYSKSVRAHSPKNNSICGDFFDRGSVFSEPAFYKVKPNKSAFGQNPNIPVNRTFSQQFESGPSPQFRLVNSFGGFRPLGQERSLFKPWPEKMTSMPMQNFGDLAQMSYYNNK